MKYGRSDLVKSAGLEGALREDGHVMDPAVDAEAKELADDLERMGPTFIKLGQLLSTRTDLLPPGHLAALARLQDKVAPFGFDEVERIVSSELGVRISKAFTEFESTPLAAASLGQVHRATLRDGRRVAVKVQRPGIREQIADDLDALQDVAEVLDSHTELGRRFELVAVLDELRRSLLRELDYREEAQSLRLLRKNLEAFERIVVPDVVEDFTTSRVLTMDLVAGTKITALSPAVLLELDGAGLAEQLFQAYLKQILVDGFFHADPHPGNVFVTEDGRLALLDLGMVARVTARMQDQLLQLVLAISDGRADDTVTIARKLGEARDDFDEPGFQRTVSDLVGRSRDASLKSLEVGRIVLSVMRSSGEAGLRLPAELTLLGKALLNLDEVARTLDPEFNPNASIRRNAAAILQKRLLKTLTPSNLFSGVMEVKEFIERLPARANAILERIANNDLAVKVDAINETELIAGMQKIANRITLGLVLAALIVGAALLMQVPTTFRILGYPGLAIVFFVLAAGGALVLAGNILFKDR